MHRKTLDEQLIDGNESNEQKKGVIRNVSGRIYTAIKDNYKGLTATMGVLVTEYGVDVIPFKARYGYIMGPIGHVLIGPVTVEIGNTLHSLIGRGNKLAYQIGTAAALNTAFQAAKYVGLVNLPYVGQDFEPMKIAYGMGGALAYIAGINLYERYKAKKNSKS